MRILVLEPNVTARSALVESFVAHDVEVAADAGQAIAKVDEQPVDCVITELSLAAHSGLEFIYEFRSYPDWSHIPVFVYSSIELDDAVLQSSAWQGLQLTYLYKPNTSLGKLVQKVEESGSREKISN